MDSKLLINSILEGIASLPNDIYLGIERTLQDLAILSSDQKLQQRNIDDDKRMIRALEKIHDNRNYLITMARLIIKNSLSYLPDNLVKEIAGRCIVTSASLLSRQAILLVLSEQIAHSLLKGIVTGALTRLTVRLGVGSLTGGILIQGLLSRAAESSRNLKVKHPKLWVELYNLELDMLYFLFDKPIYHYGFLNKLLSVNYLSEYER
ncbi:hypothetical protein [Rosenbergiella epipactidis]|uniref:hypothetical protein n=2 Tax=Rosenbergiella epipactidis TaxID=1544694 RepID=UPI001F4FFAEB|nr:hypothetical protein [Rosenbergiella epipactidis]